MQEMTDALGQVRFHFSLDEFPLFLFTLFLFVHLYETEEALSRHNASMSIRHLQIMDRQRFSFKDFK